MGKPGYLCKLYTVSYDTYIQQVLNGHHFRPVFVTNILVIGVAGLVVGGEVVLCVSHVMDQKEVHHMPPQYSGFDQGLQPDSLIENRAKPSLTC